MSATMPSMPSMPSAAADNRPGQGALSVSPSLVMIVSVGLGPAGLVVGAQAAHAG